MSQATIRRYSLMVSLLMMVVFVVTIGFMSLVHEKMGQDDYAAEATKRWSIVAHLLRLNPFRDAILSCVNNFNTLSKTNTVIEFTAGPQTATTFQTTPIGLTRYSASLSGTLAVHEITILPVTLTCRPLAVGQGLCLMIMFLVLQLASIQLANFVAQRGWRSIGIGIACLGHVMAIGFILGVVQTQHNTQYTCLQHARGERAKETLNVLSDMIRSLESTDPSVLTNDKIVDAFSKITTSMNGRASLAAVTSTFPASLPYAAEIGGLEYMPMDDYYLTSYQNIAIVAAYQFLDSRNLLALYQVVDPKQEGLSGNGYVHDAMLLGLIPVIVVAVGSCLLLPFGDLGSMESGAEGVSPAHWRMSRHSPLVKYLHVALAIIVLIGMCTIQLDNAEAVSYIESILRTASSSGATSSNAITALVATVRTLADGGVVVSDSLTQSIPPSDPNYPDFVRLGAFYDQLAQQTTNLLLNDTSLVDLAVRNGISQFPSLVSLTASSTRTYGSPLNVTLAAKAVDYELEMLVLLANMTSFSDRWYVALERWASTARSVGITAGVVQQFRNSMETATKDYQRIGTTLLSNTLNSTSISILLASSEGIAATNIENSVMSSALSQQPFIYQRPMRTPYTTFQSYAALSVAIPALILIGFCAMWDSFYTHHFFAVYPHLVPANDATAAMKFLRIDKSKLQENMIRITIGLLLAALLCVAAVSIQHTQSLESTLLQQSYDSTLEAGVDKRRLSNTNTYLEASPFVWGRAMLTQRASDVAVAVASTTAWITYLSQLSSIWRGPASSAQLSAMGAASSQSTAVLRRTAEAVMTSMATESSIMDDIRALVVSRDASRPSYANLSDCLGEQGAIDFFDALRAQNLAVMFAQADATSAAAAVATLATANASCPSLNAYLVQQSSAFLKETTLSRRNAAVWRSTATAVNAQVALEDQISTIVQALVAPTPPVSSDVPNKALFWVPVLFAWALTCIGMYAYSRTHTTMSSVNYST